MRQLFIQTLFKKSERNLKCEGKFKDFIQKQRPEVFCKKDVLRNFAKFTGKHLCQSLFFNKVAGRNFMEKETLAQVFSCEFGEISMNTFLTEHL